MVIFITEWHWAIISWWRGLGYEKDPVSYKYCIDLSQEAGAIHIVMYFN